MKFKIDLLFSLCAASAFAGPIAVAQLDESDMFPFVPSYDSPSG